MVSRISSEKMEISLTYADAIPQVILPGSPIRAMLKVAKQGTLRM
jgi:hypothetical protein